MPLARILSWLSRSMRYRRYPSGSGNGPLVPPSCQYQRRRSLRELGPADDQVAVVDAERHPASTWRDGEADLLAVAPDSGPSGTRRGKVAHVPHRDPVVVERPNHGEPSLAADLEPGGGAVVPQPGRSSHPVGVHVPTPLRSHDTGFVHVHGHAHHAFLTGGAPRCRGRPRRRLARARPSKTR